MMLNKLSNVLDKQEWQLTIVDQTKKGISLLGLQKSCSLSNLT